MLSILRAVGFLSAVLLVTTVDAYAAETGREALNREKLTACAAPNNLPFSNKEGEGFENRIAELVAAELNVPLKYKWYPQSVGLVRRTLNLRDCDLILGMPVGNERVQNTNAYYHSTYAMVYRTDSDLKLTTLADPQLKTKRIGVIAGTPPATLLGMYDLLGQVEPFQRTVDTRYFNPAQSAIGAVMDGKIDVALIWGPIAGYFATKHPQELTVVPLLNEDPSVRVAFRISMAVRFREPEWKRLINRTLVTLKPRIQSILHEFGVPQLDDTGKLIELGNVAEPDGYRMDKYHALVPATLRGAKVVNAGQLKRLMDSISMTVIDVLPSPPKPKAMKQSDLWLPVKREKITGSHWLSNVGYGVISNQQERYFRKHLARLTRGDKSHSLAFYCLADCWMSWNAAKRAMDFGYANVMWFPQGIDGWVEANYPTEKQLPIPMVSE